MDALCVYFRCMDTKSGAEITSGPFQHRCAHWGFRLLRLGKKNVNVGDELNFTVSIVDGSTWEDLNSWRWSVTRTGDAVVESSTAGSSVSGGSGSGSSEFVSMDDLERLRKRKIDQNDTRPKKKCSKTK